MPDAAARAIAVTAAGPSSRSESARRTTGERYAGPGGPVETSTVTDDCCAATDPAAGLWDTTRPGAVLDDDCVTPVTLKSADWRLTVACARLCPMTLGTVMRVGRLGDFGEEPVVGDGGF
jgi:hypothetical protein